MRVTNKMMLKQYMARMNSAQTQFNRASDRVSTLKKINKSSEDSAIAIRSYKNRNLMNQTSMHLRNVQNVQNYYNVAEDQMMSLNDSITSAYEKALEAGNAARGQQEREIIANELTQVRDHMVEVLNSKYEDSYLFGGAGTSDRPFEIVGNQLYYRGVNVNSGEDLTNNVPTDVNGDPITLRALANERVYIDIGLGIELDGSNQVVAGTAFDKAIPGISFLGFGQDSSGNNVNVVSTITDMIGELESPDFDVDKFQELTQNLQDGQTKLLGNVASIGGKANLLEKVEQRLDSKLLNLNEKALETEYVDHTEAIVDFKMQEIAYNSVLQMGGKILQNSLMDFIR